MFSIGETVTSVGGLSTLAGVPSTTLNDDGTVDEKSGKVALTATVVSTATTTAGYVVSKHTLKEVRDNYKTSYIDSLSDDQLAELEMMLEAKEIEVTENNNHKTM